MDKLIETLAGSGPWGILCAVLLFMLAVVATFANRLLEKYAASQEARIDEGLKALDVINRQNEVFQSLRDTILSSRRSR